MSCDIFEDSAGILWFGGYYNVLTRYDRVKKEFQNYTYSEKDPNGMGSGTVRTILEHGGYLWLSLDGGGLNRLDRATGKFTKYQNDPADPGRHQREQRLRPLRGQEGQLLGRHLGLRAQPLRPGNGPLQGLHGEGRPAQQHDLRHPRGRRGPPLALHQQGLVQVRPPDPDLRQLRQEPRPPGK